MVQDVSLFIKNIQKTNLSAECPHCGDEFSISKSLLFDGREKFPDKAEQARLELEKEIKDRIAGLAEIQSKSETKSEKTAVAVRTGKIIEKILPTHKNFNMIPADCRFLAEPIDFVVFDGNHQEMLTNIVLMSRKTQNENLLQLHKGIACAVKDRKYDWKTVRVSEDGQVEYE